MTQDRNALSDEQFVEQLLRHPAPVDPGAASDPEAAQLAAALAVYRQETLQWAERRSAVQPSLAAAAHRQDRWAVLPRWALATVALVTIAGAAAHLSTDRLPANQVPATARLPVADSPTTAEELAADDHLLSSIDAEINVHGASPVDGLNLRESRAVLRAGTTGVAD